MEIEVLTIRRRVATLVFSQLKGFNIHLLLPLIRLAA
jgi:hypothetical protein